MNGHPVDKIELLVLGGTWASYPHAYQARCRVARCIHARECPAARPRRPRPVATQEEFCRDLFYAANTFWERAKRPRLSLSEEQTINETAAVKIIGLTLETRPDTIDADELRRLRAYGCTRVQLGLQHVDDGVLKKINRGCTTAQAATALRRLKDACYKVRADAHRPPAACARAARTPRPHRWTLTSCPTSLARPSRWTAPCSRGCSSTRRCRRTSGRFTRRRRPQPGMPPIMAPPPGMPPPAGGQARGRQRGRG